MSLLFTSIGLVILNIIDVGHATKTDMQALKQHQVAGLENCLESSKCGKSYKSVRGGAGIDCIDGFVTLDDESYPCSNTKLLGYLNLQDLGSSERILHRWHNLTGLFGNDVWGWKDTKGNKKYAITGQWDGATIVDVTVPTNPLALAFIPANTVEPSIWRDMKTYKNYLYVVSDWDSWKSDPVLGTHGVQIYDMNGLKSIDTSPSNVANLPVTITTETAGYEVFTGFYEAHNIIINEDSGYLYAVGTELCNGGLRIYNLNDDPMKPSFVACWDELGYIHDAQCVTYKSTVYQGREICFTTMIEDASFAAVDVTDKTDIFVISRLVYPDVYVPHQVWITPNYEYLLGGDEGDEYETDNKKTQTLIFNIKDLANPVFMGRYQGPVDSIDHNLYIGNDGKYAYLSNYHSGIRVIDISSLYSGDGTINSVHEVAFFDTFPEKDVATWDILAGVWSSYPFFDDFVVVMTLDRGLFIIKTTIKKVVPGSQSAYSGSHHKALPQQYAPNNGENYNNYDYLSLVGAYDRDREYNHELFNTLVGGVCIGVLGTFGMVCCVFAFMYFWQRSGSKPKYAYIGQECEDERELMDAQKV